MLHVCCPDKAPAAMSLAAPFLALTVRLTLAATLVIVAGCNAVPMGKKPTENAKPANTQAYEAPTDSRQLVSEVQIMLTQKGFDPGSTDGVPGDKTRAALESFQRSRGIALTSGVTAEAHRQLALDERGMKIAQTASTGSATDEAPRSDQRAEQEYTAASGGQKGRGIYGNPPPGSPFSKLALGMSMKQVSDLIGEPTDQKSYWTGKSWIPFYYGRDNYRWEYRYKGQGVVTFSGDGSQTVYRVIYNPDETGYIR